MSHIVAERHRNKDKILNAAVNPIRLLLPTALIVGWCRQHNYWWRERTWGPVVTLLCCVWKQLQPKTASVRDVEDGVWEWLGEVPGVRSGSAFCQARLRFPLEVFTRAVEHVGHTATGSCGLLFRGLRVWLVDGSTLRTSRTSALSDHYGRASNAYGKQGSPLVRLLVLVSAGSYSVLHALTGAYAVSEQALFIRLLERLGAGGLIVADRAFGSFLLSCLVRRAGSHLLARLRADRQGRKVKRLGYRDKLVEWKRPKPSYSARPDLLAGCESAIQVRVIERTIRRRGYRDWNLIIVTTLTDPEEYPAGELVEIYLRRWNIETVLRTLKTHYGMAQLTGKTPAVVEREIQSTLLAYNCVVALMCASGESPELISPIRARNIVVRYALYMTYAATEKLPCLFQQMLRMLATALQLPQERGPEPRAILKKSSSYMVLRRSRAEWKMWYHAA